MKKVLSLVLAVMMVVGMTTVAFAAFTPAAPADITATQNWGTLTLGTAKSVSLGGFTNDTAAIPNASVTFTPTKLLSQPAGAPVVIADVITFLGTITESTIIEGTSSTTIKVALDGGSSAAIPAGSYKIEGTLFDSATTLTYKSIVFTVAGEKEDTTSSDKEVDSKAKITGFVKDYKWEPTAKSESLEEADQKSYLPLTADMFTWDDGVSYGKDAKFRASQLKDIGVRRVYQKGTANTIRDAELRTSDFDVRVRTVKFYPLTKETDVELKLSLTFKGSTKNAPEYEYNFTIANDEEIIEDGQSETASYGNIYLKADATVRNVEFQGDDDEIVFATKTVVKGQKYYFNVSTDLTKSDEQIIADNPEVDSIYNVYATNMANATVQFKNLDREYYVYADGKLLGTTKDSKLPLATKYVLTTAKVDFGGEEVVDEEPVEETPDVDAPPMGGGEVPPSNNYNPNTGL